MFQVAHAGNGEDVRAEPKGPGDPNLSRRTVTPRASELVSLLDDELFALNQRLGSDRYLRCASEYLDDWASPEHGWLRKFYAAGSDEPRYGLTPAVEKAILWFATCANATSSALNPASISSSSFSARWCSAPPTTRSYSFPSCGGAGQSSTPSSPEPSEVTSSSSSRSLAGPLSAVRPHCPRAAR